MGTVKNPEHLLQQIWQSYSGEVAWQAVADVSRFHRIQASPGYRAAARWVYDRLACAGLQVEIRTYPANEHTTFWARPSFQEWDCTAATLHLVAPLAEAGLLADFRACPVSVIQRSAAFDGEAQVVLWPDEPEESDPENPQSRIENPKSVGLDVAGKVVLTRGHVRRVWEEAVVQRGAVGIVFDGMRPVPPVRPEGDLADVRQYTSFWWLPGDLRCFGFVLTPRQGQELRRLLAAGKGPVRIRARVDSRQYNGTMEVVSAVIPGPKDQEVLVVAHLCHPQPSANDNASGAAAALEAARTLQSLITDGQLPPPERTIRFLWVPEMTGTFAYLSDHEADLHQMVAGINLDMVGEDQDQTGSSWLIESPPDSAASFAPDLLIHLRNHLPGLKGMAEVASSHAGGAAYPLYRQQEVGFTGGSDHYILSDPSVGVPTPALNQWPDRFYHTSADTPDRTSSHSLACAGTLAAAYAYWLATAGAAEATWLGYEMITRFKARIAGSAQTAVTQAMALDTGEALAQVLNELDRRLAYQVDRQLAALHTLARLGPVQCMAVEWKQEVERVAQHELAWARSAIELHCAAVGASLSVLPVPERTLEEREAAGLVVLRLSRGPILLDDHLQRLVGPQGQSDRVQWRALLHARQGVSSDALPDLALFWADGSRSVLDIIDRVELETGQRDVELILTYFRLLEKLDLVSFA